MDFDTWFDQRFPQGTFVGSFGTPMGALENAFREVTEQAWIAGRESFRDQVNDDRR